MRVGSYEIKRGLEWQVWEGRSLLYRTKTFCEALDLADDLYEEDRAREDAACDGPGIGSDRADDMWKMRREPAL